MTNNNSCRRWLPICLLVLAASAEMRKVDASQVRASLSSREAYVDAPILLQVEIVNARSHEPPTIPAIKGLKIKSSGVPRRSSQTTIINGHVQQRSSTTYLWHIIPQRAGRFAIPPLHVRVDGRVEATAALPFVATKSETGDLLYCEVIGQQKRVYVGQPVKLQLKIWIKPYRDADHKITLSESDMWRMISDETDWGPFSDRMQQLADNRQRPGGQEVLRTDGNGDEHSYYLYKIEATIYPSRPGKIDAGDVRVIVNYPTRLARRRDPLASFFNDHDFPFPQGSPFSNHDFGAFRRPTLTIADVRPIVAHADVHSVEVAPIPAAGRPRDYRGAVGRYQIVTQAEPATVKAGDPITLRIGVTGTGPMELLQAPPLASLPELTRDFKVPDEPLAGVVRDDAKLFTTIIRPRRAGIGQIPGIPLSYFDPHRQQFVTVRSAPISITVNKADTLELGAIVGRGMATTTDHEISPGNTAGPKTPDIQLDNYAGADVLAPSRTAGRWLFVAAMIAPPLFFLLVAAMRTRTRWVHGLLRLRLVSMYSACRALDTASNPADVARVVLQYIAARLQRNPRALTRGEAVTRLRQCGVVDASGRVDQLLQECERGSYAGIRRPDTKRLAAMAKECVVGLSREKIKPAT